MLQSAKSVVHNFGAGPSILPKEVFEKATSSKITYKVKFRHRLIIKIITIIEKILQKDISSMARNIN